MKEYTQGIMNDGPVILQDGVPMTPEQITLRLNNYHQALSLVTREFEQWKTTEDNPDSMHAIMTGKAVLSI
jgi:hypothetical protein